MNVNGLFGGGERRRETARDVNLHIETFPWPDMKQSIPQHTFLLRDLALKYHPDLWVAIGSYVYY